MTSLPRLSVENPVLVGVLMMAILIGGIYSGLTLVREMFPESRPNRVMIATRYPGATPAEVEKGLSVRLEEAVKDIEHIEKIETTISEGLSTILVTMTSQAKDLDQIVNEFKAAIDAIPPDELPEDADQTVVSKFEPQLPVISVSLYGEVDEQTLKDAGRRLRDDLLLLPDVSNVVLSGIRKAELTVEVEPERLLAYGLSLSDVRDVIAEANLDLPAGLLRTPTQNVALRTLGETDDAAEIARTILRTARDGRTVRVSDVGRVVDGFEDREIRSRFQGRPAVSVTVYKTAEQDAVNISRRVKAFVAGKRGEPMEWDLRERLKAALGIRSDVRAVYEGARSDPYPSRIQVELHNDLARFIESRLDLLKRNGRWGLALVFLSLLFFLNWRVAFWVMMGLLLSVSGALMFMRALGETLNLISMFGMIVVLGLIVDDAIVVGENVYARIERGEEPRLAAIRGSEEVAWPVIIAVCTTIGAFVPLMFIEGQIGDFMGVLPVVVTCALAMSLIESLSILPSHLAEWLRPVRADLVENQPRGWLMRKVLHVRRVQKHFVDHVMGERYERLLRAALDYRYVTMTGAVAAMMLAIGLVAGGRVPFVFVQKMDAETIVVDFEMPIGTPVERAQEVMNVLESAALEVPEVRTVYTLVGARLDIDQGGSLSSERSHLAQAVIELTTVEERDRSSEEIIALLRAHTGRLSGVNVIKYGTIQGGPGGTEIELEITGEDIDDLLVAAEDIKERLGQFTGVYDIADDFEEGRREMQITLLESARALGLTTRRLATELRGAFFGLEARTLQRDREDVDIRVRYAEDRRRRIADLEGIRVATPQGHMVPLTEVARVTEGQGFASIRRVDQRRAVVVTADVDQSKANTQEITSALAADVAAIERDLPGVMIRFAGTRRELAKSFGSLQRDFVIALLVIYVMLAGLFKSYTQPLIVLTAVPFGMIGAVAGHYILGHPLTILSLIGLVALTGIVVNDSLILVDFVNKEIAAGRNRLDAVVAAGRRRLRPILLTSMTTILGLAPMMLEQSFQARFLIPMATSISFGLMFATVLILVLVPSIYLIADDMQRFACWAWYGSATPEAEPDPETA